MKLGDLIKMFTLQSPIVIKKASAPAAQTATATAAQTVTSAPVPATMMAASTAMAPTSHFDFGRLMATLLIGAQDALIAYTNPADLPAAVQNFSQGIASVWFPTVNASGTIAAVGTIASEVQQIATHPAPVASAPVSAA